MKTLVTLFLLCALIGSTRAQISFTADEMIATFLTPPNSQTSYSTSDTVGLNALIALSGPNNTWNLSNRAYTMDGSPTGVQSVVAYPGGAPLADDADFKASTHVIKTVPNDPTQSTTYFFIKLDQTGFYILGISEDSLGLKRKLASYTPPVQQLRFPFTYQTSWESSSTINFSGSAGATFSQTNECLVDAWGSVQTPTVSHSKFTPQVASTPALRLRTKSTQIIDAIVFKLTTVSYSYQWYTKDGHNAAINADTNNRATNASYGVTGVNSVYSDNSESLLDLHLSQNPATNTTTTLSYSLPNDQNVDLRIMDALGREVRVLQSGHAVAGDNIILIDPKTLSSGTYFIHLNAGNINATRKLVISK